MGLAFGVLGQKESKIGTIREGDLLKVYLFPGPQDKQALDEYNFV